MTDLLDDASPTAASWPGALPQFDTVEAERRHRKQRLAAAFRPVREVRLRPRRRRPHHGARPGAHRSLLGQPHRRAVRPHQGERPAARVPRRPGRGGQASLQPGRLRHPLPDPRRPPRCRVRRPRPLAPRQGLVYVGTPARSHHSGRVPVLRGSRRVRRLCRRGARPRGGSPHRRRPRCPQGGDLAQPRAVDRRPQRRRGSLVVHLDGRRLPDPTAGRGGRDTDPDRPGGGASDGGRTDDGTDAPRRLVLVPAPVRRDHGGPA